MQTAHRHSHSSLRRDLIALFALATLVLIVHCLANSNYGFHRDELGTLDDARNLDWGYVSYPPLTPFVARIALALFGPSLIGLRLFAVLAECLAIVVAGLMARDLGGGLAAQLLSAAGVAVAPIAFSMGTLFQYVAFDYLWWTLGTWSFLRLLRGQNPRWWLAIGLVIGLGMMTKYTMLFFVAGLAGGVLFTPQRRWLRSGWLWAGAGVSLLLFLPNILWQLQHEFISLTFLQHIHARDVANGRTDGFLLQQLFICTNLFTLPLWGAGLYYYFVSSAGRDDRALGWLFFIPLVLFFFARGRGYYLGPAYPILFAGGALFWEKWLANRPPVSRRIGYASFGLLFLAGTAFCALTVLPWAPVNSWGWRLTSKLHDNFTEQIGWPELTQSVAKIYLALSPEERAHTAILAGNYGEAGALDLYGPQEGLPPVLSGINTYWYRGQNAAAPQTVILVGASRQGADRLASEVQLAGRVTNRYGVSNEETREHPDIFLCRRLRRPWPEIWQALQHFG